MEEDFVKTAKKYMPNLTEDQEHLVRLIARCPNYNGQNDKAKLYGREEMYKKCFCSLDLICNYHNIKNNLLTPHSLI